MGHRPVQRGSEFFPLQSCNLTSYSVTHRFDGRFFYTNDQNDKNENATCASDYD